MRFTTLLIDLDDTVYGSETGIWNLIRLRMEEYMEQVMGFSPDEIPELRRSLYQEYGTTLRGLQMCYRVNAQEYLSYVHDVEVHRHIHPQPALRAMLQAYPQKKYIFTNADRAHAERVLAASGLSDMFDGVIDVVAMSPHCKPIPEAYPLALASCGHPLPEACVMVDDSPRNLAPARALGIYTVSVGGRAQPGCSDAHIESLLDLPQVIPLGGDGSHG